MTKISNDERNMIGLPVEGGEVEEEEEEDTHNKANILIETEPEPAEIVEERTSEQEPTIAGYFPAPQDEQAEKIELLRNEN